MGRSTMKGARGEAWLREGSSQHDGLCVNGHYGLQGGGRQGCKCAPSFASYPRVWSEARQYARNG